MSKNCYCGLIAVANCTRCNAGACREHHQKIIAGPRYGVNYGQGNTLAEAAYARGYWSASRNIFVCKDCRDRDGKHHRQQIIQQSAGWSRGPFRFTMSAASRGYVIVEPSISYADTVRSWLALNWQPVETIVVPRMTRRAKYRRSGFSHEVVRPAQYAQDRYTGWIFPNTVLVTAENIHGAKNHSWSGQTEIFTDGRVRQNGEFINTPFSGATHRLLVEMSRKIFITRGREWHGPPSSW